MTAHRVDIGSVRNPLLAGNPLQLQVAVTTTSGHPGSLSACDLTAVSDITYAVFRMQGDLPANTPSMTLNYGTGIDVTSPSGGMIAIHIGSSLTALWSGRDWHVARLTDDNGQRFDIFDGYVVSTVGLAL